MSSFSSCVGIRPDRDGVALDLTDRLDRDRTPSIPGHELAGVVTALGYGTTGLSVGQRCSASPLDSRRHPGRVRGRRGTQPRGLARRRRLHGGREPADLGPHCVAGTIPARPPSDGAERPRAGAAGAVGSIVTQLHVRPALRHRHRTRCRPQTALDFGAQEFVHLENDALEDVGGVDLAFDVIGGDIGKRSAGLIRAGGTLVSVVGPPETQPADGLRSTSLSSPIVPNWVRSSSGCGTDDCERISATSRPSTMLSRPSTRPTGSRERRSSAFVRKDSLTDGSELRGFGRSRHETAAVLVFREGERRD